MGTCFAPRTRRGERQGARKALALGRSPKQQSGAQGAGDPLRPVQWSMHLTPHRVVADGWPRDGRRQPNEPSTLPSRDGSSTRRFERICPRLRLPPRRGFFRGPARSRRKFTRLEFGSTSSRDGRDCQVEFKKEQSGTKKRPLETRTCRESCSLMPPDG